MPRRQYHDPVTGDDISHLEYLTRQVQVFVRTPWFLVVFNCVTLVAMLLGHGDLWNYFASWLAIVIEWLVGTYMFGQTGRDAVVLREVRAATRLLQALLEHEAEELAEIQQDLHEHDLEHDQGQPTDATA